MFYDNKEKWKRLEKPLTLLRIIYEPKGGILSSPYWSLDTI